MSKKHNEEHKVNTSAQDKRAPLKTAQTGNPTGSSRQLMRSLMREFFQTEQSAQRHSRIEAKRLAGTPPARALEAVARHADAVLQELPGRARHHNLPVSAAGLWVGEVFSNLRSSVFDLLLDIETSYRGTLLGMRHGLDVMRMLRETAAAANQEELAEWCDRIVKAREPLIEECAQQLSWFGQHSQQAMTAVGTQTLLRGLQALKLHRGHDASLLSQ